MRDEFTCQHCGTKRVRDCKPSQVGKRVFCDQKCQSLAYKTQFTGRNNPAYGRVYRTKESHPEWAQAISDGQIRNGVNVGERNGMKRPENREKARIAANKKWKEQPELKKRIADSVSEAWADGKYEGVAIGRCKWYEHKKPDGTVVKCQGTWELAFARWMDGQNLTYAAHCGRLEYINDEGQIRRYYPDFWVEEWGCYVDVKSDYHLSLQPKKLEMVRKSNPGVELRLLLEDELRELGVLC